MTQTDKLISKFSLKRFISFSIFTNENFRILVYNTNGLSIFRKSLLLITLYVPTSLANKIEKIQRDFLWERYGGESKQHLVGWCKVCALMANSGLGIRK